MTPDERLTKCASQRFESAMVLTLHTPMRRFRQPSVDGGYRISGIPVVEQPSGNGLGFYKSRCAFASNMQQPVKELIDEEKLSPCVKATHGEAKRLVHANRIEKLSLLMTPIVASAYHVKTLKITSFIDACKDERRPSSCRRRCRYDRDAYRAPKACRSGVDVSSSIRAWAFLRVIDQVNCRKLSKTRRLSRNIARAAPTSSCGSDA